MDGSYEDRLPDLPTPNSSTDSYTTPLTPEDESDDSDLDLEMDRGELGETFRLQRRDTEKDDVNRDERGAGDGTGFERSSHARRGSASTTQSFQLYTPDESRAVVRKFDRRLVLFVALLYLLSFLDRSSRYSERLQSLIC